jgi:hypothetical protein
VIFTIATKKPFEVVLFATQAAIRPNEIHFGRCYNANNNRNANINDNYSHADAIEASVRGVDGQREAREYDLNRGKPEPFFRVGDVWRRDINAKWRRVVAF